MDVDESDPAPGPSRQPSQGNDESKTLYMAGPGTAGSVTVSLHPLVIMNISEHWTRFKVQHGKPEKVFGAIIGKQKGRQIEVMNSFELDVVLVNGEMIVDREYYNMKEEQFKQVFSDMDFLGWYSSGDFPTKVDADVHKQILDIYESPLFLQMNPSAKNSDIPLSMYESLIDIVKGEAKMLFVKLNYSLATEEAERIGLDHVAKITNSADTDSEVSKVSEHFLAQHSAIKMLASRVSLILEYIKAVEAGELPHNHEILREAKALADRLPVIGAGDSNKFDPEFYTQCNDVALMTLMGTIHKSCNDLVGFINKFNVMYNQRGQGAAGGQGGGGPGGGPSRRRVGMFMF